MVVDLGAVKNHPARPEPAVRSPSSARSAPTKAPGAGAAQVFETSVLGSEVFSDRQPSNGAGRPFGNVHE